MNREIVAIFGSALSSEEVAKHKFFSTSYTDIKKLCWYFVYSNKEDDEKKNFNSFNFAYGIEDDESSTTYTCCEKLVTELCSWFKTSECQRFCDELITNIKVDKLVLEVQPWKSLSTECLQFFTKLYHLHCHEFDAHYRFNFMIGKSWLSQFSIMTEEWSQKIIQSFSLTQFCMDSQ